jgi:hypothetical protein
MGRRGTHEHAQGMRRGTVTWAGLYRGEARMGPWGHARDGWAGTCVSWGDWIGQPARWLVQALGPHTRCCIAYI